MVICQYCHHESDIFFFEIDVFLNFLDFLCCAKKLKYPIVGSKISCTLKCAGSSNRKSYTVSSVLISTILEYQLFMEMKIICELEAELKLSINSHFELFDHLIFSGGKCNN